MDMNAEKDLNAYHRSIVTAILVGVKPAGKDDTVRKVIYSLILLKAIYK